MVAKYITENALPTWFQKIYLKKIPECRQFIQVHFKRNLWRNDEAIS
jgi:hypothetical protein